MCNIRGPWYVFVRPGEPFAEGDPNYFDNRKKNKNMWYRLIHRICAHCETYGEARGQFNIAPSCPPPLSYASELQSLSKLIVAVSNYYKCRSPLLPLATQWIIQNSLNSTKSITNRDMLDSIKSVWIVLQSTLILKRFLSLRSFWSIR